MKELSLHILDIAQNSVSAGAKHIGISLTEDENGMLTFRITDDGCGMSEETVKRVTNPFYTTRTTRKVGLGLPLLKLVAEQTDGSFSIESSTEEPNRGTTVTAVFNSRHIDFPPLGDMIGTVCLLLQGSPDRDWLYEHQTPRFHVTLSVAEMREVLGEDVPINSYEVLEWVKEELREQYGM